jgi:hypothetical protein
MAAGRSRSIALRSRGRPPEDASLRCEGIAYCPLVVDWRDERSPSATKLFGP